MMRFRNVILVIVLSLSLVLVLSCYLVRNPYLGLAGYALQLIGDIMLIYSAMAGAKRKSRGKEASPFRQRLYVILFSRVRLKRQTRSSQRSTQVKSPLKMLPRQTAHVPPVRKAASSATSATVRWFPNLKTHALKWKSAQSPRPFRHSSAGISSSSQTKQTAALWHLTK